MELLAKSYKLSDEAVDEVSGEIVSWLKKYKIARENIARIRLAAEEMVLNILKHFGNSSDMELELKIKRKIGNLSVQILYRGESFDPTVIYENYGPTSSMMKNMGIIPAWKCSGRINSVTFRVPANRLRPEFIILGSVVLAVILGLLGEVIPKDTRDVIIKYALDPLSDTFMDLLTVFSGMLIFLSIVVGICGIGGGAEFGKFGKFIIGRYVGLTFVFGGLVMLGMIPFFSFTWGESASFASTFDELFKMVLGIVPDNLFKPFLENNMLQILMLAILFGVVILGIGDRSYKLRSLISDVQMLFMNASELICKALPVFVFCSLLSMFWTNGMSTFVELWQPIVGCIVVAAVFIILQCVYVSIKFRMSPLLLFGKIMPSFIVGLSTASSLAAFGKGSEINRTRLGISTEYSDFAYPMGMTTFDGVTVLLYVPMTFYLVQNYNINVSIMWFVSAWFVITMLTYAAPQVSGGSLICVGIILDHFGIPSDALAIGSTIALLMDFFVTGAKVASQHFEMILQADHLKMLDVEKLRSKEKTTV